MATQTCLYCGKEFAARTRRQVACLSATCRKARHRDYARKWRAEPPEAPPPICVSCGRWFERRRGNQRLCGEMECRRQYQRESQKTGAVREAKKAWRRAKNPPLAPRVCDCGAKFKPATGKQVTCGKEECQRRRKSERHRVRLSEQHAARATTKQCKHCGCEFVSLREREASCGSPACKKLAERLASQRWYFSPRVAENRRQRQRERETRKPTKTCPYCGVDFVPRVSHQKICGQRECRNSHERSLWCARPNVRERRNWPYGVPATRPKICRRCKQEFAARPRQECCERPMCVKQRKSENNKQSYRNRRANASPRVYPVAECNICGRLYSKRDRRQKLCGDKACLIEYTRRKNHSPEHKARDRDRSKRPERKAYHAKLKRELDARLAEHELTMILRRTQKGCQS